jgi:ABC-type nitrate/sulfonate/bicarbonate transport system substrate-binding protein
MRTHRLRGTLEAVLALALGAAALPFAASAATTIVVGKAVATSDPVIPVDVGKELGIFKKHGLDVTIVNFLGGAKMAQAMTAGDIDIGDAGGTELAFIAKGAPMMGICETSGPFSFLSIGVPEDSPITSIDGLRGKKIGVSSPGSLSEWLAKDLAVKKGWGAGGITPVAIGNGVAGTIAAFREHLVDADLGGTNQFLNMEEKHIGRPLVSVADYEGSMVSGLLTASDHIIKTNPQAVRAFIAGWVETVDFIRTHKAETVKLESGITHLPESVTAKEYDITHGNMFTTACEFDDQSIAELKRSLVALKLLPVSADMSKFYTTAFLPKGDDPH